MSDWSDWIHPDSDHPHHRLMWAYNWINLRAILTVVGLMLSILALLVCIVEMCR